jgi:hypothetical protein
MIDCRASTASKPPELHVPDYSGRLRVFSGASVIATSNSEGPSMLTEELPPEHLSGAQHAENGRVSLRFADGYRGTVDLAELGMDPAALRLESVRASSWGSAVEVEDRQGKTIHIDSAVLRARCDRQYAMKLREAIAALEQH